ncbi:hypothetical protein [Streptomyces mirabilis]|uniref:hypothetical protein n=1 Tax=Streptomyces mirabilis TaxID=68239 RepID=UPI0036D939FD
MEFPPPPMAPVSFGEYEIDELIGKLVDADENLPFAAAARLVCEHRSWLENPSFYRFLQSGEAQGDRWVGISWPDIVEALKSDQIEGSKQDLFILKLGASMTMYYPIYFRTDHVNLSDRGGVAVMRAIGYLLGPGEDVDEYCPPFS